MEGTFRGAGNWSPPPEGWLKLNCNGSVIENSDNNSATCGGIIRDSMGDLVAAYIANIGNLSIIKAELCAVYIGLKTLFKLEYLKHVLVETDSLVIVRLIQERSIDHLSSLSLAKAIRELMMARDWTVEICHVDCEANQCAQVLAKRGHVISPFGVSFFDRVPAFLSHVYMPDMVRSRSSFQLV